MIDMSLFNWSDKWVGEHESPISLCWKFAWANDLKLNSSLVTNKRLQLRKYFLLKRNRRVTPIGTLKNEQRSRREFCDRFNAALAYCVECLKHGYIADGHQHPGLKWCPLHPAVAMKRICTCCGEPTKLAAECLQVFRPFFCDACGQPLCGEETTSRMLFLAAERIHPIEKQVSKQLKILSAHRLGDDANLPVWPQVELRTAMLPDVQNDPAFLQILNLENWQFVRSPLRHERGFMSLHDFKRSSYILSRAVRLNEIIRIVDRRIRKHHLRGIYHSDRGLQFEVAARWKCASAHMFDPPKGIHPLMHAYWLWRAYLTRRESLFIPHGSRDTWLEEELSPNADIQSSSFTGQLNLQSQLTYLLGTYFELARMTWLAINGDSRAIESRRLVQRPFLSGLSWHHRDHQTLSDCVVFYDHAPCSYVEAMRKIRIKR